MADGLSSALPPAIWSGRAEDLALEVERLIRVFALPLKPPSVRTIRLWRTKKLLSGSGGFGRRQLLEAVMVATSLAKGWSHAAIADHLTAATDADLVHTMSQVTAEGIAAAASPLVGAGRAGAGRYAEEAAEECVVLLAQGILKQYDRILAGKDIVRQDDSVPHELHRAMFRLGRLYIEEGQADRAACVHDVLARACFHLRDDAWGLDAFRTEGFKFRDALLVDPDLRVPTADCGEIAKVAGRGEDNIVEARLHARLRDTCERLGSRRHEAYAVVREFLVRQSLTSHGELLAYLDRK
jgi:hypothetical protein